MTIIQNSYLRSFLALNRINKLWQAFKCHTLPHPIACSYGVLLLAIIIACIPILGVMINLNKTTYDAALIFSGTAFLAALLLRNRIGIRTKKIENWKAKLALTHTAFGLSCIPLALILAFNKQAFYTINLGLEGSNTGTDSVVRIIGLTLFIALWAGITEEIIYRGLLLSCLRRIKLNYSQATKDYLAIVVSSALFGLNHYLTWGAWLSFAIFCLGLGFGVAYIAVKEKLLPLVLYHIAFDILSLSFAFFTYRM